MPAILGIDFGSRLCRTAVWSGGEAKLFPNRYSERPLPTLVASHAAEGARPPWVRGPVAFTSLKQQLGVLDVTTVHGAEHAIGGSVEEVFSHLRQDAQDAVADPIAGAVVAVPGCFAERPRKALVDAARAGLRLPVRLIDESLTAVFARDGRAAKGTNGLATLVYALGAGVFSTSVVATTGGGLAIRAAEGNRALGGAAIDAAIVEFLLEELLNDSPQVESLPDLVIRLRPIAEALKQGLSRRDEETFDLQGVELGTTAGSGAELTLTRTALEAMIAPVVDETLRLALAAVEGAGLTPTDIGRVLLVGASTRTPLVERRLQELFPVPAERAGEGDLAIGAATHGGALDAKVWEEPAKAPVPDAGAARNRFVRPQPAPSGPSAGGTWFRSFAPRFDEAEAHWSAGDQEAAIRLFSGVVDEARKFLGNLHYQQGEAFFRSEQYDDAILEQQAALRCNPDDEYAKTSYHRSLNRKAIRLLRAGRLSEARATIQQGLRLDPDCAGCRQVASQVDQELRHRARGGFTGRRGRRR